MSEGAVPSFRPKLSVLINLIGVLLDLTPFQMQQRRLDVLIAKFYVYGVDVLDNLLDVFGRLSTTAELEAILQRGRHWREWPELRLTDDRLSRLDESHLDHSQVDLSAVQEAIARSPHLRDARGYYEHLISSFERYLAGIAADLNGLRMSAVQRTQVRERLRDNVLDIIEQYLMERRIGPAARVDEMLQILDVKARRLAQAFLATIAEAAGVELRHEAAHFFGALVVLAQMLDDYHEVAADFQWQPNMLLADAQAYSPHEYEAFAHHLQQGRTRSRNWLSRDDRLILPESIRAWTRGYRGVRRRAEIYAPVFLRPLLVFLHLTYGIKRLKELTPPWVVDALRWMRRRWVALLLIAGLGVMAILVGRLSEYLLAGLAIPEKENALATTQRISARIHTQAIVSRSP